MTTQKRKLNVPLLRRIQKVILKTPSQFQMATVFDSVSSTGRKPANCGTAACIAGWAVTLQRKDKMPRKAAEKDPSIESLLERAARLLGVRADLADDLFINEFWPEPFCENYRNAKTDRMAAKVAASRIEHLIKTGE